MRQFIEVLSAFAPPPKGDWGWVFRRMMDLAVRCLRQLTQCYFNNRESVEAFSMRAMAVVRLYVEEAFHRALMGARGGVRKGALCSLMVSMRNCEQDTLPLEFQSMGVFMGAR